MIREGNQTLKLHCNQSTHRILWCTDSPLTCLASSSSSSSFTYFLHFLRNHYNILSGGRGWKYWLQFETSV